VVTATKMVERYWISKMGQSEVFVTPLETTRTQHPITTKNVCASFHIWIPVA
jgi:hypothetical protein